jgi:hypothetical protein
MCDFFFLFFLSRNARHPLQFNTNFRLQGRFRHPLGLTIFIRAQIRKNNTSVFVMKQITQQQQQRVHKRVNKRVNKKVKRES